LAYNQGDIVIVDFPFTNLTDGKVRPALVVSCQVANSMNDVILAQMTSTVLRGRFACLIENKDLTVAFKPPKDRSYVSCRNLITTESSKIHKMISKLSEEKIQEVLNKILTVFDKD